MLKLVALSLAKPGSACARILAASSYSLQSKRTLIEDSFFGQDLRAEQRKKYLEILRSAGLNKETYLAKLTEQTGQQATDALQWDDLNILLALAQTRSDVQLVHVILRRLQEQSTSRTVPNHIVKNLIRMYRALNLPEAALEFYRDPSLAKQFSNRTVGLLVVLDLMFDSGKFDTVVDLFEARKAQDPAWQNNESSLLFVAACYRLGTAESFKKLLTHFEEPLRNGHVSDKAFCLASLLAIKQKQPDLVSTWEQRVLRRETSSNILLVRMIKAQEQGNYDELASLLQLAFTSRLSVTTDVFNSISALITKLNADTSEAAKKQAGQISSTLKELSDAKLLSFRTLEDRLLRPQYRAAAGTTKNVETGYDNAPRRDRVRTPGAQSQQSKGDGSSPYRRERTARPANERRQFPAGSPGAPAGSPPRTPTPSQPAPTHPWPYGVPDHQGHYFVPGWVVPNAYYGHPNWPTMQGAPVWPAYNPSNWPVAPYPYPPQPRWPVANQGWFPAPRGQPKNPRYPFTARPPFGQPQPQPPYGVPRTRYGTPTADGQSGPSVPQDGGQPENETVQNINVPQPGRWNRQRRQRPVVSSAQDTQDSQAQDNGSQPQTLNKDDGKTHSG